MRLVTRGSQWRERGDSARWADLARRRERVLVRFDFNLLMGSSVVLRDAIRRTTSSPDSDHLAAGLIPSPACRPEHAQQCSFPAGMPRPFAAIRLLIGQNSADCIAADSSSCLLSSASRSLEALRIRRYPPAPPQSVLSSYMPSRGSYGAAGR
jgi:hypothetical protein